MTAVVPDVTAPADRAARWITPRTRARAAEPAWVRPAFAGVTLLSAVLYTWNLAISGYANTYYSAAALAASKSWSAFFFGSFDAANFITIDKPPFAIWIMGLSVRLFGLSPWSILLPEALAGVLTVALVFVAVRRSFGPAAGLVASIVMALTPAAVLMFRFNNPDGVLTLLLVAAGYALLRALDDGSYRWVALSAALVGCAFLTKYLQAYLVLPGFALVYGFSANTTLRRRLVGLVVAAATVLGTSGWWVAIVQLIPAADRPFIGGSTTGSPLDLIFGYDGLGRIFGGSGPGGGPGGGGGFSGEPGLLRLFNDQVFGQIAWMIPPAIAALVLGLWLRRWAARTDPGLAGYLLWGSWFVGSAVVLSYMSGIMHSYYTVALAPAVAALVGAGAVDLWRLGSRHWLGAVALGAALLGTAAWGAMLLARTPGFAPLVGPIAIVVAAGAAIVLAIAAAPRLRVADLAPRLSLGAAVVGVCAALLAPGAYAVSTATTSLGGGDPHPGPGAVDGRGGVTGFGGQRPGGTVGTLPGGAAVGQPFGDDRAQADQALADYLVSHQGGATWIVALNGAQQAGLLEIETGEPVMAMGGFTGSDPTPTLAQIQGYVASGKLRYVITGGAGFGRFGGTDSSSVSSWVTSACAPVDGAGATSLYDCSGAAS